MSKTLSAITKVVIIVTLFLSAIGCAESSEEPTNTAIPTNTATPTNTPTPANTPTPTNTPEPILVEFNYFQADGIRMHPALDSEIFKEVYPGDKLYALNYQEKPHKVYYVRLEDGTEGWLFWKVGMFEPLDNGQISIISVTATPTRSRVLPSTSSSGSVCSCSSNSLNCDDFSTHSQAQACFNYCIGKGAGDIHDLDRDNDKSVCED